MPLDKVHLFDAETGEALTTDRAAANVTAAQAAEEIGCGTGLSADRTDEPRSAPEGSGADLIERVVDSRILHRGRYLTFRIDTIERADGTRATRDVAGHPGAVAIVAVDPDDQVLLVRQYRSPAERALLEIPAGTLDERPDGRSRTRTSRRDASSRRRPATGPGRGNCSAGSGRRPGSRPS